MILSLTENEINEFPLPSSPMRFEESAKILSEQVFPSNSSAEKEQSPSLVTSGSLQAFS